MLDSGCKVLKEHREHDLIAHALFTPEKKHLLIQDLA